MKISASPLLDGNNLQFGDFNVFIGGNGVGKTTFLTELYSKSTGVPRNKFHWIGEPTYSSDDVGEDLMLLKSSLSRKYDGPNLFYYSQAIKGIDGNVDLADNLRFSLSEFQQTDGQNTAIYNDIRYRRPFIAFSNCEARLGLPNEVEITGLDQPPQDPINVLYRNGKLLKEIDKTVFEIFKLKFVLLDHTRKRLHLGLSIEDPPIFDATAVNFQDEFEKIQRWKDDKFVVLTEAGHGIRSMIRLLTSVLEPVNEVIMIDEPEMHLYPSQKRWLGKQLVSLAKNRKKQVFLVTHDPMVLQGVLDANTKTNIFRIERSETNTGIVKTCELDRLSDANAMRNQDQYLQGLFYQRCIVVEGASDRSFYQNMIEDYTETHDKDLGFVACGGKGGTKHMANIVAKVGLNTAFIYDFDALLFETALIKEVYLLLGGNDDPLEELTNLLEQNEEIKNAKDAKERNKRVKEVTGYSDKGGISGAWADTNRSVVDGVIDSLAKVGIFIVPNGTLESWAPDVEPKVRFAELAPDEIKKVQALDQKFREFSKRVLAHLKISIN